MFMEDYRLPAPLVGMLRASKLTGKPIVKTELLATKLHVTISWDLATSAPRKTKNRQSTKTAKQRRQLDSLQDLRLNSLLRLHQRLPLQLLCRQTLVNPAPKRCHLKWQLDGWGFNRRACLPPRFVSLPNQPHQLQRRRNTALYQRLRRHQPLNDLLPRLIPLQGKMTTPSYSDASLQLQSTTRR